MAGPTQTDAPRPRFSRGSLSEPCPARPKAPMTPHHILISGCSGGGKSTLLSALAQRGFATVPEPGRRIVAQERAGNGNALPWVKPLAFARHALDMAASDLATATTAGDDVVFFDRGMIDAAVACAHAGGPSYRTLLPDPLPYARRVFLTPPWPEIFVQDAARQHGLDDAEAEYLRLSQALDDFGYETHVLPKAPVQARVDIILADLGLS
ncbi:ATPase-like protein [Jannaschia sp. CCS1]|nr:ATPase-like protein [Jannaschia sp. CCS1]